MRENYTYFMHTDELGESARLLAQDRLLTFVVDLLPAGIDPDAIQDVLDLGCDPGGWLLDLLSAHPHIAGVGVDVSKPMLRMAQYLQVAEDKKLTLQEMDVREGLAFADESFDLVNMRLTHSFLLPPMWVPALKECFRVLRPGGSLVVTDLEMVLTNKPYSEEFQSLMPTVWSKAHLSFSPMGRSMGIMAQLNPLLRQTGFTNRQIKLCPMDVSKGEDKFDLALENLKVIFAGTRDVLIKYGGYSEAYLTDLAEKAYQEMDEEDFSSIAILFTTWCSKPEQ